MLTETIKVTKLLNSVALVRERTIPLVSLLNFPPSYVQITVHYLMYKMNTKGRTAKYDGTYMSRDSIIINTSLELGQLHASLCVTDTECNGIIVP
jgi:hypothetical protein